MSDIKQRIKIAKNDALEMEKLLIDYLPFIKKQLSNLNNICLEYDDMLSISMYVFVNVVYQYEDSRGNFLSFCSTCIKNRLLDESKKQFKYSSKKVPLSPDEDASISPDDIASAKQYDKDMERQRLASEIDDFSAKLSDFNISFSELTAICPKQTRSKNQCIDLAKAIINNKLYKDSFLSHHRLPQAELAKEFKISVKTIEKHRKYIVTLVVLLLGDYPGIKSFLPYYKEVVE